ncbi:remodeling and spacing factor 1 isoform X2 [Cimex lectularius]|uniref:PHD-type domain-containing protein n=1 Tax=Cimex lectularius TaxID=79782 RepID=A0A8I6R8Y9_CIMLE|nr:remodeling and spacing factor 1 isoform X2 [Cimex lectularius]
MATTSENDATAEQQICTSFPEFAIICSFFEMFSDACGIPRPGFNELQEMLENTSEVKQSLIELHIKLMRKARKTISVDRWERALSKFAHKYSQQDGWEIERFGYKNSKLEVKLRLLKALLELQFDCNPKFKLEVNKLTAKELRLKPLGTDDTGQSYWCQFDPSCNLRVYKEDTEEETWDLVAKDRDDLVNLIDQLSSGEGRIELNLILKEEEELANQENEKHNLDMGQQDDSVSEKEVEEEESEENEDVGDASEEEDEEEDEDEGEDGDITENGHQDKKTANSEKHSVNINGEKNVVSNKEDDKSKSNTVPIQNGFPSKEFESNGLVDLTIRPDIRRPVSKLDEIFKSKIESPVFRDNIDRSDILSQMSASFNKVEDLTVSAPKKPRIIEQNDDEVEEPLKYIAGLGEESAPSNPVISNSTNNIDDRDVLRGVGDDTDEVSLLPSKPENPHKDVLMESDFDEVREKCRADMLPFQMEKEEPVPEFSEVIEEDVMVFSGLGSGVECDTGNPGESTKNESSNKEEEQKTGKVWTIDSLCDKEKKSTSDVTDSNEVKKTNENGDVEQDLKNGECSSSEKKKEGKEKQVMLTNIIEACLDHGDNSELDKQLGNKYNDLFSAKNIGERTETSSKDNVEAKKEEKKEKGTVEAKESTDIKETSVVENEKKPEKLQGRKSRSTSQNSDETQVPQKISKPSSVSSRRSTRSSSIVSINSVENEANSSQKKCKNVKDLDVANREDKSQDDADKKLKTEEAKIQNKSSEAAEEKTKMLGKRKRKDKKESNSDESSDYDEDEDEEAGGKRPCLRGKVKSKRRPKGLVKHAETDSDAENPVTLKKGAQQKLKETKGEKSNVNKIKIKSEDDGDNDESECNEGTKRDKTKIKKENIKEECKDVEETNTNDDEESEVTSTKELPVRRTRASLRNVGTVPKPQPKPTKGKKEPKKKPEETVVKPKGKGSKTDAVEEKKPLPKGKVVKNTKSNPKKVGNDKAKSVQKQEKEISDEEEVTKTLDKEEEEDNKKSNTKEKHVKEKTQASDDDKADLVNEEDGEEGDDNEKLKKDNEESKDSKNSEKSEESKSNSTGTETEQKKHRGRPKKVAGASENEEPKKRRKRHVLMGLTERDLKIAEEFKADASSGPGEGRMRQSRRIAQLKIKEEAERRAMEEATMAVMKSTKKKDKKKDMNNEDKGSIKKKKKKDTSEEEDVEEGDTNEVEDKSKKKKKKKKDRLKFKIDKPWMSSSCSSSENEEDEDEHSDDYDEDHYIIKKEASDHEFSPESDLEKDGEVVPVRRARTACKKKEVKKEEEKEDEKEDQKYETGYEDYSCEKCGLTDQPEWILLCDTCDKGYHASCLRPPLMLIPEGDWFCPPCQHAALVKKLKDTLRTFEKNSKRRANEELRRKRLAYVGISLANVLADNAGNNTASKNKIKPKGVTRKKITHYSSESTTGESSSSGSSDDEDEPVYQLRQRRAAGQANYRFSEYDDLINSAIQDEIEVGEQEPTQAISRGKDMETIIKTSGKENDELGDGGVQEANDEKDEGNERNALIVTKHPALSLGRKKSKKLNDLDVHSDDHDSDEDFKGSSEEDDDYSDIEGSDDSVGWRSQPLRRSNRARQARIDKEFINDDSEDSSDGRPRKKKSKRMWEESESESSSDRSWGRRRRKPQVRAQARTKKSGKRSGGSRKKQRNIFDSDSDVPRRTTVKKPKIKYGPIEEELDTGRKTRGKKINFREVIGSDSDDELGIGKKESDDDEFVLEEGEEEQLAPTIPLKEVRKNRIVSDESEEEEEEVEVEDENEGEEDASEEEEDEEEEGEEETPLTNKYVKLEKEKEKEKPEENQVDLLVPETVKDIENLARSKKQDKKGLDDELEEEEEEDENENEEVDDEEQVEAGFETTEGKKEGTPPPAVNRIRVVPPQKLLADPVSAPSVKGIPQDSVIRGMLQPAHYKPSGQVPIHRVPNSLPQQRPRFVDRFMYGQHPPPQGFQPPPGGYFPGQPGFQPPPPLQPVQPSQDDDYAEYNPSTGAQQETTASRFCGTTAAPANDSEFGGLVMYFSSQHEDNLET